MRNGIPGLISQEDIMTRFVKNDETTDDLGFKTVIHDSNVLSWILRSNVDELKDKSIEEIKKCLDIGADGRFVNGRNIEYASKKSKTVKMDSVFDVRIPGEKDVISVIVNVEGQGDPDPGYPLEKMAEYYVGRMISTQKGRYFKGMDFGKLRKVYGIWIVFNPKAEYRNTAVKYSMKAESLSGDPDREMPVVDAFNILFINIGPYDESLPDVSAFPAALFSKMPDDAVHGIMKDRYNLEYDDVLREGVEKMSSLREDTYNWGFREGREEGREEGSREKGVDVIVSLVIDKNWSIEEALDFLSVSNDMNDPIRAEVFRRLGC